jgi:threonine/homoserine/homoserine lactone efflux protein
VDLLTFIATVVAVTASGALAPGPLFFANVAKGAKSGAKSGLVFSVAHSIIEFSLVVLLALSVFSIANEPSIKLVIGVAGGIALVVFGFLQIRWPMGSNPVQSIGRWARLENLFLIGLLFTGLNPYFILWWLTIGLKLISDAWDLGLSWAGIAIMYMAHVWMDYAWLTATAYLAKKGINLIGSKGYKIMMILFGIILLLFGFYFLTSAL